MAEWLGLIVFVIVQLQGYIPLLTQTDELEWPQKLNLHIAYKLVKHYTNLYKKHWCLWTTVRCYDRKQMAPHAVCSLSHMRSNTFYRILERLCTNLVLRTRSLVAPGNYNERLKKHSAIVLIFKWSFISCKRLSILFNDKRFTESYLIRMAREFCQQKPHKLMAQGPNREIGKVRSNTENSPFYQ